jgi:hypothetical protein
LQPVKKKKKKPQKSGNAAKGTCNMEVDQPSKTETGVENMEVDASA